MRYTVHWTPAAERDLADVWLNAADRNAVTSASHVIDLLLAQDPDQQGEVCFDTVRTLVVSPLGVDFEVIEDDRIVYVLTVWDEARGRPN
jgi:plasmid stabilization system protein ParE